MVLTTVCPEDLPRFKRDMQDAFQLGAAEGGFPGDGEPILPESHIDRSLNAPGAISCKALLEGEMVGGAIIAVEGNRARLDLLYVKHGVQSRGVGRLLWFEIEKRHPEVKTWETCTPYFEKRNIHFYVNVCVFCITEFFNARHPDSNSPEDEYEDGYFEGMFQFRKETNYE